MAQRKPSGLTLQYYAERLAEPELLERGVLLDVRANDEPIAVPVGKQRRGGHIEFFERKEAQKGLELLKVREGFPNARVVSHGQDYFELRWGEPPPFDGCDYCEPMCGLLLGLHYGYRTDAIASLTENYQARPRKIFGRAAILKLIKSARNPR